MKMIVIIAGAMKSAGKTAHFAVEMGLLVSLLAYAIACQAQSSSVSKLRLSVVDSNHAAIVGARVTIENVAKRAVLTDAQGNFSASVLPGEYAVQVEADGFAPVKRSVKIMNGETEPIEIVLPVAEST